MWLSETLRAGGRDADEDAHRLELVDRVGATTGDGADPARHSVAGHLSHRPEHHDDAQLLSRQRGAAGDDIVGHRDSRGWPDGRSGDLDADRLVMVDDDVRDPPRRRAAGLAVDLDPRWQPEHHGPAIGLRRRTRGRVGLQIG